MGRASEFCNCFKSGACTQEPVQGEDNDVRFVFINARWNCPLLKLLQAEIRLCQWFRTGPQQHPCIVATRIPTNNVDYSIGIP